MFYQGGVGQVQWYVCMYVIRIYDVIFSSGPFHNISLEQGKQIIRLYKTV